MGETDRSHRNERKPRRRSIFLLGAANNALVSLFAINMVCFLILMMIQVGVYAGEHTPAYFYSHVVQWVELPAGLQQLSERPWTFLTYMFTDTGSNLIRLIGNMIWLWGFGNLLQQMAGNDKLIPVYIYGGLAGAMFFIASHYLLAPLAPIRDQAALLGANASVMAVAMATTTLQPNFRFFTQIRNGIPIWVLMGIYLLIDLAGVAGLGAGFALSHLGGALAGFLFVVFLRRGKDGSVWMNSTYRYVMNLFEPKAASSSAKDKIFYQTGNRKPFTKTPINKEARVDEILDKINRTGYHFLTDEEKEFLRKASEEG